jgi:hypothetical protein
VVWRVLFNRDIEEGRERFIKNEYPERIIRNIIAYWEDLMCDWHRYDGSFDAHILLQRSMDKYESAQLKTSHKQLIDDGIASETYSEMSDANACPFLAVKFRTGDFFCTCQAEYASNCIKEKGTWCPFEGNPHMEIGFNVR